jgi:hypothetical protein
MPGPVELSNSKKVKIKSRALMDSIFLIQVEDTLLIKPADTLRDKIIDQIGISLALLQLSLHLLHLLLHLLDVFKLFGDLLFFGTLFEFEFFNFTPSSFPFRTHFQKTCASRRFAHCNE